MKDLCTTDYVTVNHMMLNVFVEIWHTDTSSFHLSLGEMSITLDDMSCLLDLLISGKLIDHGSIIRDEALEMIIDYLRFDPDDSIRKFEKSRGAHTRFEFLKKVYTNEILRDEEARGENGKVGLHIAYDMRAYLLYLVDTAIFMENNSIYTDVVYLRYCSGVFVAI